MTKGSIGYSGKSSSPKSGRYGLEESLGGINGYHPQGKGGMVYMVIGIGYAGNAKELAQRLQQYLPILGQYLSKMSEGYGKMPQKYDEKMVQKHDSASLKGFFKPYNVGMSICEICRAPTPDGVKMCPTCSVAMRH